MSVTIPKKQYFSEEEINNITSDYRPDYANFQLISNDSYDEELIAKRIDLLSSEEKQKLLCCAIQTAIVGFGRRENKRVLGKFTYDTKEVDIYDFYVSIGVENELNYGSNPAPEVLTPKRIIRFFRYEVKRYLEQSNRMSYLYKKYSTREEKYRTVIFPMSEHMIEDLDEANYLLQTYNNLDSRQVRQTNLTEKVIRAFEARGMRYNKETMLLEKNIIKI